MNDFVLSHLETETEYVHFISLAYSMLNNLLIETTQLSAHKRLINSLELLKASTLITDDIIDATQERNNKKSIVAKLGISKSVLVAEQLKSHSTISFIESLKELKIEKEAIIECILIFEDTFRTVSEGQLEDIGKLTVTKKMIKWDTANWKKYCDFYISVIYKTTSAFIQLPFHITNAFGKINSRDYDSLLSFFRLVGIAYQLRDDIVDVVGESKYLGKHRGGDIFERKIRLPFIEFFNSEYSTKNKKKVYDIMLRDNMGFNEVDEIIDVLYDSGAIESAILFLNKYCSKAMDCLTSVSDVKLSKQLKNLSEILML